MIKIKLWTYTIIGLITIGIAGFLIFKKFISNERAGQCNDSPKRHVRGWFFCEKLLSGQFVMLPNCDVVLCCISVPHGKDGEKIRRHTPRRTFREQGIQCQPRR